MGTVLITGVGREGQVGEAVAAAFAARGDHVLLVDRLADEVQARAATIGQAGGRATPYTCDLTSEEAVGALASRVAGEHAGRLDALVNLAGGWFPGSRVADLDLAAWDRMFAINLRTALLTTRALLPLLRAGRGSVVFFASEAVLPGAAVAGMSAYLAAKQGVAALMQSVAQEEHVHGVRANALAPAAIRTRMNVESMGADARYVEREQVAEAVLWLCSPAASAVTGQLIRLAPA